MNFIKGNWYKRIEPFMVFPDEDDVPEEYAADFKTAETNRRNGIHLSAPNNFEDVKVLAKVITERDNIVINIAKLPDSDRRYTECFLLGLTYQRGYELKTIGKDLIVCRVA